MADEPRRSGRATKGQYTKDRDIDEKNGSKRQSKGRGSKAKVEEEVDGDEEDEKIRCVCGHYEPEEETERSMICCDNCEAWQHNDCMGLPNDPSYAPAEYFCEECKPENHKELLAAMARGEKPWEEVAKRREAAEAEKATKKKGGKRGRKSAATRANDAQSRASQEADQHESPATTGGANGHKRKLEEQSNGAESPQDAKKPRQAATPGDTPSDTKNGVRGATSRKSSVVNTPSRQASKSEASVGGMVSSVDELTNAQRKGVATLLVNLFIDQTNLAVKQGVYKVPQDQTAKEIGTKLGIRVEHAVYHIQSAGSEEPNEAYRNQSRTIRFNVKKNPALRDRLLSGNLSAHVLAAMDAKDMASEELQQRDAALKKEAEKQHTIIEEQGPRIRRTHKGEEYVDESKQVASESTVSHAPVRRPSIVADAEGHTRSPDPISPTARQSVSEKPLLVNTHQRSRPSIDTQRRPSTNFNIQDVWSSVQGSPDADRQQFPQLPNPAAENRPGVPGTQADADIDELLKDEEVESPPYSPKDVAGDSEIVWRGIVNGGAIGRFHASARYAAGAMVDDLRLSWQQLIPEEISIEGRIDPAKADVYLCGLQYSSSSDVVIISISEPEDSIDQQNFDKLFSYFKKRNRYGVGVQHSNPAIKDIYLIPLEAGADLPELLQLLEKHKIEGPTSERLLLVPFVIKNTELATGTPRDQVAITASPLTSVPQGHIPPTPPSQPAPPLHQGSVPPPTIPFNHSPHPQATLPQQPMTYYPMPPSPAAIAAQQVLGHMAGAPAIQQLITQVPHAGVTEMDVIKDIITENPMAAQDLQVLTQMLQVRNQPRPQA